LLFRGRACWQDAERAYQLWKARQVADQQGRGAVVVVKEEEGKEGEAKEALVDFAVNFLKGDLFPELMDFMWGGGCPQGEALWGMHYSQERVIPGEVVGAVPKPGVGAVGRGLEASGAVPAVASAVPASTLSLQGRQGREKTCRIM
jgi:hypothetical protein